MTETDKTDTALEALFEAARVTPPKPSEALMDRLLADAVALQPAALPRGWRYWFDQLGGSAGLGGLVTATCVGFWIGIAPPEALPDVGALVLGAEASSEADTYGFGWDIEEG